MRLRQSRRVWRVLAVLVLMSGTFSCGVQAWGGSVLRPPGHGVGGMLVATTVGVVWGGCGEPPAGADGGAGSGGPGSTEPEEPWLRPDEAERGARWPREGANT